MFRFLLTILLRPRRIIARVTFINLPVFLRRRMQSPSFRHGPRQSPRLLRGQRQNLMQTKAAALATKSRPRATTILGAIPDIGTRVFSIGPGNID
jgi:hypothetical protein